MSKESVRGLLRVSFVFVLQYVAVCCSVLQCVAVRGGVSFVKICQKRPAHMKRDLCKSVCVGRVSEGLLRVCRVCVCVAVCCSVLQCVRGPFESLSRACVLQCIAVCCSALQCIAVCCSVLQCVSRSFGSLSVGLFYRSLFDILMGLYGYTKVSLSRTHTLF